MAFDAVVRVSVIEQLDGPDKPIRFICVPTRATMHATMHVKCRVTRPNGKKVTVKGTTLIVAFEDFTSEVRLRLNPARFPVGEHVRVEVLESCAVERGP